MGQYHKLVNFDKKEYVEPWLFRCGLKLIEQIGRKWGISDALYVLISSPHDRGGGDIHGANESVVGRWAGDRIAVIGDYAKDDDIESLRNEFTLSDVYGDLGDPEKGWRDISGIVKIELTRIEVVMLL